MLIATVLDVWNDSNLTVYAIAFAPSAGSAFVYPAASSLVPMLVSNDDQGAANGAIWSAAVLARWSSSIVHTVHADVEESIKRTVQPYFVLDGSVCGLLATKGHVNLFVHDGAASRTRPGWSTHGTTTQRRAPSPPVKATSTSRRCSSSSERSPPTTRPKGGAAQG